MAENIEVLGVLKLTPDQQSIDQMVNAIQSKLSNLNAGVSSSGSASSGSSSGSGSSNRTSAPETKPVESKDTRRESNNSFGNAIERAIQRSRLGQAADRLRGAADVMGRVRGQAASAASRSASVASPGGLAGRGLGGAGVAAGGIGAVAAVVYALNKASTSNINKLVQDSDTSPAGGRIALLREISRRQRAMQRSEISGSSSYELESERQKLLTAVSNIEAKFNDLVANPAMKNLYKLANFFLKKAGVNTTPVDENKPYRMFLNRALLQGYNVPPPIPGMPMIRPIERSNLR